MKVLHVYQTYFPDTVGGLEEAIRQICLATSALGVQNSIFCCGFQDVKETYTTPEARIIKTPRWFKKWSCTFPHLAGVKDFQEAAAEVDVVHYHLHWPVADMLDMCISNKPLIITYHSDLVRQRAVEFLYAPLRSRLFRRANVIIATSSDYAHSSKTLLPHLDKVQIIPLCMDFRHELPALTREPYVFFVGMLRYYKGLEVLLDAAKISGVKILVAGKGELHEHLRTRIREEHIQNLELLGEISEADKILHLRRCSALVLPSINRAEAFGMVLLEALKYDCPIITTSLASGNNYVARQMGGQLLPPNDAPALARKLSACIDQASANISAYPRAKTFFGSARVGAQYLTAYQASQRS
ncbi:MAG: hypothetical protein RLZZ502_1406 [Pseudomonadota bacterium]|jgi:rhamnosyl/mannosyltransferase